MHGREPPPVEILEQVTAKGGDILSRTVENFKPPNRTSLANGGSESPREDSKTPKEEKMDIDDPGSGPGRVTRGELVSANRERFPRNWPFTHVGNHRSSPTAASKSTVSAGYHIIQARASTFKSASVSSTNSGNSCSHWLQLFSVIKSKQCVFYYCEL